jgi:hypothetical protein
MSPDRGLEATRAIREKLSQEQGNDPRHLVEHYLKYQEQFAGRLRWASASRETSVHEAEPAAAADDATRRS